MEFQKVKFRPNRRVLLKQNGIYYFSFWYNSYLQKYGSETYIETFRGSFFYQMGHLLRIQP